MLGRVQRDYGPLPLYVTENGAAYADEVAADGTVPDPLRMEYLDSHFRTAHRAIADGIDLRGYFVWTLIDNFEWAWGYSKRFGLVYVDYPTQRRIPKHSARWFGEVTRRATACSRSRPPDARRARLTAATGSARSAGSRRGRRAWRPSTTSRAQYLSATRG